MKLRGRNLSVSMRPANGADVRELHEELALAGARISDRERGRAFFGPETERAVKQFQQEHGLDATGIVDAATARALGRATARSVRRFVRGQVLGPDGKPVSGMKVRALDKEIRAEQRLGEDTTDSDGQYQIAYALSQAGQGRKPGVDIVVRVIAADGSTLAESPVVADAPPTLTVDLVVEPPSAASEFAEHVEALRVALGGPPPGDLTEAEIEALADRTGIPGVLVALLDAAHKHASDTGATPEVLYGLFRQGMPTNPPALLAQPPDALRAALVQSIEEGIIARSLEPALDRLLATMQGHAVRVLLDAPDDEGGGPPRRLLIASGLTPTQSAELLKVATAHDASSGDVWDAVANVPALKERVEPLRATLELSDVVSRNTPLVEALQKQNVRSARDLARLGPAGLRAALESSPEALAGVPAGDAPVGTRIDRYVGEVFAEAQARYPTAALAGRFTAATQIDLATIREIVARNPALSLREPLPETVDWGGWPEARQQAARASWEALRRDRNRFPGLSDRQLLDAPAYANPLRQDVVRVLANVPDLDLETEDVDAALAAAGARAFEGVQDRAGAVVRLKTAQRLLRVASNAEHADALAAEGFTSARDVAAMPADAFEEAFAASLGGPAQARMYHERARSLNAAVTAIVTSVRQPALSAAPGMVRRPSLAALRDLLKGVPNLESLFGNLGGCECGHCRSVYSPAAYLVDLLQFLSPRVLRARGSTVKPIEVLRARRPDIEHIRLTCENTNTPLPYLDLVNEILEFFVANESLAPGAAHDTGHATAEELRAAPQHVNEAAYAALRAATHPFLLPFDRHHEIVSRHLAHAGVSRSDIMRAFARDEASAADGNLAALQLSPAELALLTGTGSAPTRVHFGYEADTIAYRHPDGSGSTVQEPWTTNMSRAAIFSARTSGSLEDLNALLDTRFVNADRHLSLRQEANAADCDLHRLRIQGLTEADLARAHRFVRLARKLQWSVAELDAVLTSLAASDIDRPALFRIADALAVVKGTGVPIHQAVAFWSALTTRGADSLYSRVFLSRLSPGARDGAFKLNADRTELADTSMPLTAQAPAIAAALGLGLDQLQRLVAAVGLTAATLNLASLSAIYRHVALARALRLSLDDLAILAAVPSLAPFANASPETTRRFVEAAEQIRASGFSIAELARIYGGEPAPSSPDPATAALLAQIRDGLIALRAEAAAVPSEDAEARFAAAARAFVLQRFAEDGRVAEDVAAVVLEGMLTANDGRPALEVLLSLETSADTTAAAAIHWRWSRVSLLVSRLALRAAEIRHLQSRGADFGGFDLSALGTSQGPAQFAAWRRLVHLALLLGRLPGSDPSLLEVFNADQPAAALDALVRATGWDASEVAFLAGPAGLALDLANLRTERGLMRIERCLELAKRLGVPCSQLAQWASGQPDAAMAQAVTEAVRARHDAQQWPAVARSLNDPLRERQRDALVAHLLASFAMRSRGVRTPQELFHYLLLDTEMSSCMATSRIKQAISSVQLFIQSCLLNLEPAVPASALDADRWEWMKSYRVWEANRKVFLYPENWIEPELRDDKSPFFIDLEQQLLQSDITEESVERAFLAYLEKLDDVARLEICGHCSVEDGGTETMHIIGRTRETPHVYYHRQFADGVWTPWDRVPADIEGNHILPVVYNRRLFLFWLHFEQKPDESQELPRPYIQSADHYKWLTEDMPAWKEHRAQYEKDKAIHEYVKSLRSILKGAGVADADIAQLIADHGLDAYVEPPILEPQPTEPPYSTPPILAHWQVRLCWSEWQFGQWSGKRTSKDALTSSWVYDTLADFGYTGSSGTPDTIADIFLPPEPSHAIEAVIEGDDLRIDLRRRYVGFYEVVGFSKTGVHFGHEIVGHFRFTCGSKVVAVPGFQSLEFDGVYRPYNTTNVDQVWKTQGPGPLRFDLGGKTYQLLSNPPPSAAAFRVLLPRTREGADVQPSIFTPFVYQDDQRVYLVTPAGQDQLIKRVPGLGARLPGVFTSDTPVISGARRLLRGSRTTSLRSIRGVAGARLSGVRISGAGASTFGFVSQAGRFGRVAAATRGPLLDRVSRPKAVSLSGGMLMKPARRLPALKRLTSRQYLQFHTLFHPHICELLSRFHAQGVSGLLSRQTQMLTHDKGGNRFNALYHPGSLVHPRRPEEDVDFDGGAYSVYNWELFFHIPVLIATALSRNRQFEQARRWFHFIFDPTTSRTGASPDRYWNTLPLSRAEPEREQARELLEALSSGGPGRSRVLAQINAWRDDPFNPHLLARMRLTAYQSHVVMKYLENLIAWGDDLFRRDTLESINEATLLYVLAARILGPRPVTVRPASAPAPRTYAELASESLDAWSNALVELENGLPQLQAMPERPALQPRASASLRRWRKPTRVVRPPVEVLRGVHEALYFCIPGNDHLLSFWDTVADRLFKIRHCQNIDGVQRELALFEPPIDPALLVRARAAGLSIDGAVAGLHAPRSPYRFTRLLARAMDLCAEVRSLGGTLLGALEKKDAEAMSRLRAAQETSTSKAVRAVKERQIQEASATLEGLQRARLVAEARRDFFARVERISKQEETQLNLLEDAHILRMVAQSLQVGVSVAHSVPNFDVGTAGWAASPVVKASFGGDNVGSAITGAAKFLEMIADQLSFDASVTGTLAEYERRWAEWKFQQQLAEREIAQIDRQVLAAEIRLDITRKDLELHDRQTANLQAIEDVLRTKYTSEELYGWLSSQLSRLHFQMYQLALEAARQAERALQYELDPGGAGTSGLVGTGSWDNLRKGLLAGEQLALELKRLEYAYHERHRRELELTRHVSLAMLRPAALLELKETGRCEVEIPESLFDLEYPGHYMRRLRSVSLSIPCVTGPYTGISCTLTLLQNRVRRDPNAVTEYAEDLANPDPRFEVNLAATESIATSHGQNDSGMFEVTPGDERYLPFEGAGAISRWRIELPAAIPTFDYGSITDVVMHLRYTARDGGEALRARAAAHVVELIKSLEGSPLMRLFSVRHELPAEWHRFLHPVGSEDQVLRMDLGARRFPYFATTRRITVTSVDVYARPAADAEIEVQLTAPGAGTVTGTLQAGGTTGGLRRASLPVTATIEASSVWDLKMRKAGAPDFQSLKDGDVTDVAIVCRYTVG